MPTTAARKNAIPILVDGIKYPSKSQAIYALADQGVDRSVIRAKVGCKYQMVRNILMIRELLHAHVA